MISGIFSMVMYEVKAFAQALRGVLPIAKTTVLRTREQGCFGHR